MAAACALALSACVGGTTYGTGVSQEAQTISDLSSLLKLKNDRKNIDYSARPDLVIPKDTSKLPQPVDAEATTSSPDWPETPEQRIARIRSTAGKVQSNTGDYTLYDVTTQLQSEKQGVLTLSGTKKGQTAADGATQEAALPTCSDNADAQPGVNCIRVTARKYLTEPPTAYRIPAASAPTGEEAFTEEDLLKRKQRKKAARDAANGTARKSTVVWE